MTGANRGIGLQLVKVLSEHGWSVFGTVRPETRSDPSFADASVSLPSLSQDLLTNL